MSTKNKALMLVVALANITARAPVIEAKDEKGCRYIANLKLMRPGPAQPVYEVCEEPFNSPENDTQYTWFLMGKFSDGEGRLDTMLMLLHDPELVYEALKEAFLSVNVVKVESEQQEDTDGWNLIEPAESSEGVVTLPNEENIGIIVDSVKPILMRLGIGIEPSPKGSLLQLIDLLGKINPRNGGALVSMREIAEKHFTDNMLKQPILCQIVFKGQGGKLYIDEHSESSVKEVLVSAEQIIMPHEGYIS